VDLTQERTRHWQRLEKLLEDALITVSSVAGKLDSLSVRDMLDALLAGERDPRRPAGLARGTMKAKRPALVEALTGQFDDHHAELARILLDQIDTLSTRIDRLTTRTGQLLPTSPVDQASGRQRGGRQRADAPGAGDEPDITNAPGEDTLTRRIPGGLTTWERLEEIPGIASAGRATGHRRDRVRT
jgi:hypothetical protein